MSDPFSRDTFLVELVASGLVLVSDSPLVTILRLASLREDARGSVFPFGGELHSRWRAFASVPMLAVGQVRGGHIHAGADPAKNPEAFLVLMGDPFLEVCRAELPDGLHQGARCARLVGEPSRQQLFPGAIVLTWPRVYHRVEATGVTMLIELLGDPSEMMSQDYAYLVS